MAKIPGEKPQYLKLYEELRKKIISGKYTTGDLLPSENNLNKQYKVTQPVIRQALSLLVDEGYIRKHQGKGSIVQSRTVGVGIISKDGKDISSQLNTPDIETRIIKGPVRTTILSSLFVAEQDEKTKNCFTLERLRLVSGTPVFCENITISDIGLNGFQSLRFNNSSFYETIREKYGIRVTMSRQRFRAVKADRKTVANNNYAFAA